MPDDLLELYPDPLLLLAPDGRVLGANEPALRLHKRAREAVVGRPIAELCADDQREVWRSQLAQALQAEARFEAVQRDGAGALHRVEVHARAVRVAGAQAVSASLRSLEALRKFGQAVRHTEERLRLLLEQAPLAVVVLDHEGRLEYANPFFLHLAGRTEEQVVGQRMVGAFLADRKRTHFQSDLATATGTRHVSWTQSELGEGEGYLFVGADMTESFHSEAALRRSERRFRALVEGSPDGVALCHDGRVLYANPALAALLGRSPESMVGLHVLETVHPEERTRLLHRLESPTPRALLEVLLQRTDGTLVTAELASIAAETDRGPGLLFMVRDVSERVRMQSQLVKASRLASVGTLAAGVAHEINNPLAFIDSNLQFLRSVWARARKSLDSAGATEPPLELRNEVDLSVQDAAQGVERVRQIVERLKEFARAEGETEGPLDVRGPVRDALAIVSRDLEKRALVVRELNEAPLVEAGSQRLVQVFVNVLLNAAQAIPDGRRGEVRVSTRADERGFCEVRISDDGVGIAPQDLDRLFDPFFTTRATGSGEGLGLSLAYAIVSSLGGEITVDSTQGKGSTFHILLPPAG